MSDQRGAEFNPTLVARGAGERPQVSAQFRGDMARGEEVGLRFPFDERANLYGEPGLGSAGEVGLEGARQGCS